MLISAAFLAGLFLAPAQAATTFEQRLDAAMERVARLKYMDMDGPYKLPVHGAPVSGRGVDFVDRRTSEEVLDSGLSTGCGDSAGAFYALMKDGGAKMLFIQSAELSAANLLNMKASGHTAVAVQDPDGGRWLLVDPTNHEILSRDWDPASKLYGRRWIGYKGPAEGYFSQITEAEGIGRFFERALLTVPKDVLDREITGIDFVLEPSLTRADGTTGNRAAKRFAALYSGLYRKLGISPKRLVTVRLDALEDDKAGVRCRTQGKDFFCDVSRTKPMDDRLFSWIEESAVQHAP